MNKTNVANLKAKTLNSNINTDNISNSSNQLTPKTASKPPINHQQLQSQRQVLSDTLKSSSQTQAILTPRATNENQPNFLRQSKFSATMKNRLSSADSSKDSSKEIKNDFVFDNEK